MNCIDHPCKYLFDYCGEEYCILTYKEIPEDIDITQCENFVFARTCLDCANSTMTVYETGTIDEIEYRCKLQNNKLTCHDLNPYCAHYSDIPECNIGKFLYTE